MHGHHKHRLGDRMVPPLDTHGFMARADSAHALSSTTIIIIAVCCSVGGIVLGFAMWRLFRAYRSTSAPLPPVQPLARHREQYAQDSDKSLLSVWNAERRGSRMHVFPSDQASDDPSFSSRHASFQTDDSDPTLTLPLEYPNPAFKSSLGGRDSSPLGSNYTSDEFLSPPPTPPSAASTHSLPHSQSVPSDMGAATGRPIGTRPARPSSRTRSSYASYSSTSANSRNTIRGSPHGPHSSIQIVLPSPLSPQLHPYSNSTSRAESREDFSSHNSVVDRWVSPSKAGSMYGDDDEPTNTSQDTLVIPSSKGSSHLRPSPQVRNSHRSSGPPSVYPQPLPATPPQLSSPSGTSVEDPLSTTSHTDASPSPPPKPQKLSKKRS